MNTTIAIDKKTKEKAEKRAKKEGISISTLVRIFLNDYANGKLNIGIKTPKLTENGFTEKFEDKLLESMNKTETYGPFETTEDLFDFLDKE